MPRQIPPSQQLNEIIRAIYDELDELTSRETLTDIGDWIAERLRMRARSGKTATYAGSNLTKLKPLSSSYIKFRTRNRSKLHKSTSPKKSNLTFSGQLLDSIKARIRGESVIIGPTGRRFGGGTNERIAIYVQDQGRPFLYLGRRDISELVKIYDESLQDLIDRNKILSKTR